MLLSSFFTRSMAFTHTPKVQLPFALFSETFLTIRQNSLYVTVCIIARPSYRGYFIHSLSTLHYCNAPSLATLIAALQILRKHHKICGTMPGKLRGYFTNKDFPVISAGCSIPINSMSVGMISAKHPFSLNL